MAAVKDDSTKLTGAAFAVCLLAGLIVRVALTATSVGTNDVVFMIMWARLANEFGIAHAYAHNAVLNHPPLSLLSFHLMDLAARRIGIEYTDVMRLVQIAADVVTTAALARIARLKGFDARAVSLMFWLSPAAIAISAFHCNTDPTMVALTTVAVMLALDDRATWSGAALALATGIKILPLLALPIFFIVLARRRAAFLGAFAAVAFVIFVPARLIGGPAVWRNVFAYSGFPGKWGITGIFYNAGLRLGAGRPFVLLAYAYAEYGKYVLAIALVALFAWLWRSRSDRANALTAAVPLAFLLAIFLAPGFGIQYLVWPLPLLPFLLPRSWALALNAAFSAYAFLAYTIWSRGFPWWYADSVAPTPGKIWVTIVGIPVWLLTGAAIAVAIRNRRLWTAPQPDAVTPS